MQRLGDLRLVDRAHITELLGNNQVGPDLPQQVSLDAIQALSMRREFVHGAVYLGGRQGMRKHRVKNHWLLAGLWWIVAFKRHPCDGLA